MNIKVINSEAETNESSDVRYLKSNRKRIGISLVALSLLIIALLVDIGWGPSLLPFSDVIYGILFPNEISPQLSVIIWDLRLPIAFTAVLVGAMLGMAGAEMQTILNNPLADPFILGISSAASFGAALGIVLQVNLIPIAGPFLVTVNAFIMAIMTSFVLFFFTKLRGTTPETMVLVGIALMFTFNALLALMQYSASETELAQIIFWMMGSLSRANWTKVIICLGIIGMIIPYFIAHSWSLTALRMGDDKAESMGVNIKRLRVEIMIIVSILAATAVSFVGTIAFVGLVGPHIARMLVGEDQRFFLPLSAIASALIMSITSVLSKAITVGVIYPIGMITSLIGIPFFISLILAIKRNNWK